MIGLLVVNMSIVSPWVQALTELQAARVLIFLWVMRIAPVTYCLRHEVAALVLVIQS